MALVKTMKGKTIDIGAILAQSQDTVAIGNANMNARGDILGKGGEVVKTAASISKSYNTSNPKAVKRVSLKDMEPAMLSPEDAMAEFKRRAEEARKAVVEAGDDFTEDEAPVVAEVVEEQPATENKKKRLVDK